MLILFVFKGIQVCGNEVIFWVTEGNISTHVHLLVSFVFAESGMYMLLSQANKTPKASETPHVPRSQKWSKRDKMEYLRQLMRWGLPLVLILCW